MSAEAIAQLILLFAQSLPAVIKLAEEAKAAMSAPDQAAVDAAIEQLRASAMTHLSQAETDLDAAAQQ